MEKRVTEKCRTVSYVSRIFTCELGYEYSTEEKATVDRVRKLMADSDF